MPGPDRVTGVLPGGHWDAAGRRHRRVEVRGLTGREEEQLAATAAEPADVARRVTQVLTGCLLALGEIASVTDEVIRHLSVGDRDYLLMLARRATFGDQVRAHLVCPWPGCAQVVTVDLRLSDLPVRTTAVEEPLATVRLTPGAAGDGLAELRVRLPDGSDQEALSELATRDAAAALSALLARLIVIAPSMTEGEGDGGADPDRDRDGPVDRRDHTRESSGAGHVHDDDREPVDPHAATFVAGLSPLARAEIEAELERVAPAVDTSLDVACAGCGRVFTAPLNLREIFFGDLGSDGAALTREVHFLALHYHWSEPDILDMTRAKRRTYIDLLTQALGEASHAI